MKATQVGQGVVTGQETCSGKTLVPDPEAHTTRQETRPDQTRTEPVCQCCTF